MVMGMMGTGYGGGYGPLVFMGLFSLLTLALFFTVVWWLIRNNTGYGSSDTPEDILRKRLARGEITTKEYRKLHAELKK